MSDRNSWEGSLPEESPFVNVLPDPGGPEEDRNEYGRGFDSGYIKGYQVGFENGLAAARRALQEGRS